MSDKILIVDDDLETLRLVGLMLQRQGYQIVAANNGAQALAMAKTEYPALILLDVMMPDMDGYEVTRRLRADPETADTPILMFTAKSQVEDKVTGYEAGVDDYLTKPTHPAELNAHVKVLLARAGKTRAGASTPVKRGHVVGVMAVKGGLGTSTVALNTGISLNQKYKLDVLVAELRPGNGTIGAELGYTNPEGLKRLLQCKPSEITREAVEKELIMNASGVRLLLAGNQIKEVRFSDALPQVDALVNQLSTLGSVVILDIGTNQFPEPERILNYCNEVILVLEPNPTSVALSKEFIEQLADYGVGKTRILTTILVNRIRADIQLTWSQVQEAVGQPISVIFTPAPELAYQTAVRFMPISLIQPEGLIAQQFGKLAEVVNQHIIR